MKTLENSDSFRLPGLLIVDPDASAGAELAREMKKYGWVVWFASDAASALDTYQKDQQRIDLVLVDLQLPGLQGGSLLAELAQLDPELVRCAMSGDISPYAVAAFRKMSDTPLFTKPLSVRSLAYTFHEMIAPVSRYSDAHEATPRSNRMVMA